MSFTYKTTPVTDILEQSGANVTSSYGFKYINTTKANSRPLPINYRESEVDIATKASAKSISHNSSATNVAVPSGVKACRYILRGGGGGGGGGGGAAVNFDGTDYWRYGGSGKSGNQGKVTYTEEMRVNTSNYSVTIGTGGNSGSLGNRGRGNTSGEVSGNAGGIGNAGNETYVTFANKGAVANGGNGGAGGVQSNAPGPGSSGGADRQSNDNGTTTIGVNTAWDATHMDTGNGGEGGLGGNLVKPDNTNGGSAGGTGNSGSAHIIWLYD